MNRVMARDRDFITSGLYGLLIGDALGVPYEFHDSSSIPPADQIEFEPPPGFRRSHRGVAPGTWSDDGSQALCLFESLTEHPELDCCCSPKTDHLCSLKIDQGWTPRERPSAGV